VSKICEAWYDDEIRVLQVCDESRTTLAHRWWELAITTALTKCIYD